ncbi:MAG: LytR family transcriptional regulator [Ruminococcaceae bacterium]|nr:LytR family transcriptional regulator [Oscillospiraceae bacterium]
MKKKTSKKKIFLICLLIFIVIIVGTLAGIALPLIISYNTNAYEEVDIVERSDEYVEPATDPQPDEWANVTIGDDEVGRDLTSGGTLPHNVNGGGGNIKGDSYDRNASFGRNENTVSVYGKTPIYKVPQKDPNIENILVLGTDSRDVTRERGRSDAIIILSYNKKTGAIKMVSVLRDCLVPIEGRGWNRINAAYSFDGVGLAVNTVNRLFDLDIQRFVVVDFNGVTDFIDRAGGVTISLTQKEVDYLTNYSGGKVKYNVGPNNFNGDRALAYMRIRKIDSDFKRTERQRNVIVTLAKKILSEKSLAEIYDLTDFAFGLVKTNISLTELTSAVTDIATGALKNGLNIESQHVPYSGAYVNKYYNGMAIVSFDIDDAARRVNNFIYG